MQISASQASALKNFARKQLVCFIVLFDGLVDDFLRKRPVVIFCSEQPVTDELFVIGRLGLARLVLVCRPESGAVRCQDFVSEDHVAVLVETELELRVGDYDPFSKRIVCALFVYGDGKISDLLSELLASSREVSFEDFDAPLERDVLIVVADLSLRARRVDGLRKLV